MNIEKVVDIQSPADHVWTILAHQFDRADQWMAAVPRSYEMNEAGQAEAAPVGARVCELTDRGKDGLYAEEVITGYSEARRHLDMVVHPHNGAIPIRRNRLSFDVEATGSDSCRVKLTAEPELKAAGYVLYPVLRVGLSAAFARILEELGHFAETGRAHPRKVQASA